MFLFDIVPAKYRQQHWRFRVLGVSTTKDKGGSDLAKFLKGLKESEIAGFMKLFALYCENGKEGLTSKMFHSCDVNRNLYQFRKGNYRITCFIEEGNIVICSHGFLKSGNETPRQEQDKTDNLRSAYLAAKKSGRCQYIEDQTTGAKNG